MLTRLSNATINAKIRNSTHVDDGSWQKLCMEIGGHTAGDSDMVIINSL